MTKLYATKRHEREGNLTARTVRNVIILLGKIVSKAVAENYLRHSPMTGVELPEKGSNQKGRALKPDQIRDILAGCSPRLRPIFLTAVLTGMRRAEQFGLDWEYLDFERNVVRIERCLYWKHGKYQKRAEGESAYDFVKPKTNKARREIDLAPQLRKELLELSLRAGGKGLVFRTSKGTPYNPENIVKRDFREALQRAEAIRKQRGVEPIGKTRWHDLRHSFGSLLLDQGESIFFTSRGRWGILRCKSLATRTVTSWTAIPRQLRESVRSSWAIPASH